MTRPTEDFLPHVIDILERLAAASSDHGQPMLASMLDLARSEAQDALNTTDLEAAFRTALGGSGRPARVAVGRH